VPIPRTKKTRDLAERAHAGILAEMVTLPVFRGFGFGARVDIGQGHVLEVRFYENGIPLLRAMVAKIVRPSNGDDPASGHPSVLPDTEAVLTRLRAKRRDLYRDLRKEGKI
jgi:hypothetical protein